MYSVTYLCAGFLVEKWSKWMSNFSPITVYGTQSLTSESPWLPSATSNSCCQISSQDTITMVASMTRFTSCPFITRLYIFGNHGHVCEDCKCIRCVVYVGFERLTATASYLPLAMGCHWTIELEKNVWHVAMSQNLVPIFPPEFCFCDNPEKKNAQCDRQIPNAIHTTRRMIVIVLNKERVVLWTLIVNTSALNIVFQCFLELRKL